MVEFIRLSGLLSRCDLNDQLGVIVQEPTDSQPRYTVRIEGEPKLILVKKENFVSIPCSGAKHVMPVYFSVVCNDREGLNTALHDARAANSLSGEGTIELCFDMPRTTKQQWIDTSAMGLAHIINKMEALDVTALPDGAVPELISVREQLEIERDKAIRRGASDHPVKTREVDDKLAKCIDVAEEKPDTLVVLAITVADGLIFCVLRSIVA